MKKVCLVNGSLRGKEAASLQFLNDLAERLPDSEFDKTVVTVKLKVKDRYPPETLQKLAEADALVFIFPLHNYGIPGALMRLMEDYWEYIKAGNGHNRAGVYMVVNCAFPRPAATCGELIRVMRNFCARLGLDWRFSVNIGTGPVVVMTRKVPLLYLSMKRAWRDIAGDIRDGSRGPKQDYFIKPVIPEGIVAAIKRRYEKKGRMRE